MQRVALVAVVLLVSLAAMAGPRKRVKEIEGKQIVVAPALSGKPAVELRSLRFHACTLKKTGQPCTVVVGSLVSHLPHRNFVVTVEFELLKYKQGNNYTHSQGTLTAKVIQPAPGSPRKFVALGPSWFGVAADGSPGRPAPGEQPRYLTKITHRLFKPDKDGFWKAGEKAER